MVGRGNESKNRGKCRKITSNAGNEEAEEMRAKHESRKQRTTEENCENAGNVMVG